jgi:anti-sigma regulatory factor (Ser/Thr protein kinase)
VIDRGSGKEITLVVPCDRLAPRAVRGALSDLVGLEGLLDDLMLVANELVTNAVIHSGGTGEHPVRVTVWTSPGHAVISVHDPGISGQSVQPHGVTAEAMGGWGLQLVDQLAVRWGTERSDGYRVWAEMAL